MYHFLHANHNPIKKVFFSSVSETLNSIEGLQMQQNQNGRRIAEGELNLIKLSRMQYKEAKRIWTLGERVSTLQ